MKVGPRVWREGVLVAAIEQCAVSSADNGRRLQKSKDSSLLSRLLSANKNLSKAAVKLLYSDKSQRLIQLMLSLRLLRERFLESVQVAFLGSAASAKSRNSVAIKQ